NHQHAIVDPQHTTSTLFPYTTLFRSRKKCRSPIFSRRLASRTTKAKAQRRRKSRTRNRHLQSRPRSQRRQRKHLKMAIPRPTFRSEEHTSELQSRRDLVCRLLLEKKK